MEHNDRYTSMGLTESVIRGKSRPPPENTGQNTQEHTQSLDRDQNP